jgi:N6-L-threonylcarbamoyladenine synthase
MRIVAIETSCDETSVAVVEDGTRVLSNCISSQIDLHAKTGGVVPEVAAREQLKAMQPVLKEAMEIAGVSMEEIDAFAVTKGPGLVGSLLVGVHTAKTLSYLLKKPLIGVNHLEGHIYANWLERETREIRLPAVVLTVSGGHNELILMTGHREYSLIGRTLDDAAGEAFDKTARLIGLGYPGGVAIQKAALNGTERTVFPRAWLQDVKRGQKPKHITNFNFSFSGLKTAVWQNIDDRELSPEDQSDYALAIQNAIVEVLGEKTLAAAELHGAKTILLSGGVSANLALREYVEKRGAVPVLWPKSIQYCTDNAAMIAAAAYQYQLLEPLESFDWKRVETDPNLRITYIS